MKGTPYIVAFVILSALMSVPKFVMLTSTSKAPVAFNEVHCTNAPEDVMLEMVAASGVEQVGLLKQKVKSPDAFCKLKN